MKWARAAATLCLFVASCKHARPSSGRNALREQARNILRQHCGVCHIPGQATTVAGALAVFDLSELDWSRRMSERQLRNALWRLGEPIPPEGRPNDVTDEERRTFARYVDAELRARSR